VVPGRQQPRGPLDGLGAQGREQAGPAEKTHDPAVPPDRRRGRRGLVGGAPVEPGDRRANGAAVRGGRDERRALADDADGDRLDGAAGAGLGAGDPDAGDERRPPGLRPLLGPTGGALEEEAVRNPGEAAEAAVEAEDADLHGRGPEVDGDEGAGVGGHEAEW
jgi:hypothetical protein